MRRVQTLMTVAILALAACSGRASPSMPFEIATEARGILTEWQRAGLECGLPQVGEPGPAVDWFCRGMIAGSVLTARLTVDRQGVQSIIAGTAPEVDRRTAIRVFEGLLGSTSAIAPVRSQIAAWLLASDPMDDWMPPTPGVGIVHLQPHVEDGSIELYLVPAGSSIMSVSPQPTE